MPSVDFLPRTAGRHFDLYFYAAIARLQFGLPGIERAAINGGPPFIFLESYFNQLPRAACLSDQGVGAAPWYRAIEEWEQDASQHLPLRALRQDGELDHDGLTALAAIGLVDEDSRFALLFESLQRGGSRRPTAGTIADWWGVTDDRRAIKRSIDRLVEYGIVAQAEDGIGMAEASLRPMPGIWDALRGDDEPRLDWIVSERPSEAPSLSELTLPDEVAGQLDALCRGLGDGTIRTLIVRGPGSSGRRTLLRAIAAAGGRGTLTAAFEGLDSTRLGSLGSLATAVHAMPVISVDPEPGETLDVRPVAGYRGPVGITLPLFGAIRGPNVEVGHTVRLAIPAAPARRQLWNRSLGAETQEVVYETAVRQRMTAGNIRRVAAAAVSRTRAAGRAAVGVSDVLEASRDSRTHSLEAMTTPVAVAGSWDDLVVQDDVRAELGLLEERCRSRERLVEVLAPPVALSSAGVRILLTGPSGTGKTLAARILASVLGFDLFALEVGRVLDKYLGVTEKNLTAVFAKAGELDAMLLMDEGDSLLTSRTDVRTSNDRYANLQTNHLLQLLEAHDGIVVITSNAGDRIDSAFQRRLDVVIEFRAPDASMRRQLWQKHLPQNHEVDPVLLSEIAARCALTGGQIRNAVLHAWLVALRRGDDVVPASADVDAAIRREYQKLGATCPLPPNGD